MHFRKFDFTFFCCNRFITQVVFLHDFGSTVKCTSHAILLSHDHQGARCAYSSPITAAPTTSSHRCCSSRAATSHRRCPFASRCCIHHTHYRSLSFAPAHSLLITATASITAALTPHPSTITVDLLPVVLGHGVRHQVCLAHFG